MGVLDGKAAIVTGSARGIGRATAELLAEHGASVLVNDLDGDAAEEAGRRIDGETVTFAGDLTREGVPEQLVNRAVEAFGKLDIVVNNAGYTWDGPIHKMTDRQFRAMVDIHATVPFQVLRAAAPHLREPAKTEREEGREVFRKVVNVSSASGTMGNAGQSNYSAGKAGVIGLTKTLAKEWGQLKINVNAVAFGFVETRLTAPKEEGGTIEREGQELELSAVPSSELAFDVDRLRAEPGMVTLVMANPSPIEHNVSLGGRSVDEEGETVPEGGTSTVSADVKPGEYTFYCSVPGHREGGMLGTLTVGSGGEGGHGEGGRASGQGASAGRAEGSGGGPPDGGRGGAGSGSGGRGGGS